MSFASDVSPSGAFDLAGNAWEWTADWYDATYYEGLRGRVVTNPGGPAESQSSAPQYTIKGSSKSWDLSYREGMRIDARLPFLGFRCALSVGGTPAVDEPEPEAGAAGSEGAPARPSRPGPGSGGLVPF